MKTVERIDQNFDEFVADLCRENGINYDSKTKVYSVPSSSQPNIIYTVRYEGAPEFMNPAVNTWTCTCPSRQTCKHIKLVSEIVDYAGDEFGYE